MKSDPEEQHPAVRIDNGGGSNDAVSDGPGDNKANDDDDDMMMTMISGHSRCTDGGGDDDVSDDDDEMSVKEDLALTKAKEQTRHVRQLRLLVLLVLVAAAVAVAAVVYAYTRTRQVQTFQSTFDGYARQILGTVQNNARYKLEAISALALHIQDYAITTRKASTSNSSNSWWPYVTVPYFEEHVMATKSLTDAVGVLLFPIVSPSQKEPWERYSVSHRDWLDESYKIQRYRYGKDGLELDDNRPGSVAGKPPSFATHEEWFDKLWGYPDYDHAENPDYKYGIASQVFKTLHNDNDGNNDDGDDDPNNNNNNIFIRQPRIDNHANRSGGSNADDDYYYYFPQWQASPASWYYQSTVNLDYGHYPDFKQQTEIINETHTAVCEYHT